MSLDKCIQCNIPLKLTPTKWLTCPKCKRSYVNGGWIFAGNHWSQRRANILMFLAFLRYNDIHHVIQYYCKLHPCITEEQVLKCFIKKKGLDKWLEGLK